MANENDISNEEKNDMSLFGEKLNNVNALIDKNDLSLYIFNFLTNKQKDEYNDIISKISINDLKKIIMEIANIIPEYLKASVPRLSGSKKLLDLLGTFSLGVSIFSCEEKIQPIYMSKGYLDLFEIGQYQYNDELIHNIVEEDLKILLAKINDAIKNNSSFQCEYRVKLNNKIKWNKTRCIPIDYPGHKNVFLSVASDTTESHLREEELLLEKEKLNLAFEQTNSSIWEYDIRSKEIILSDSLARFYGYDSTHISNALDTIIDLKLVHEKSIKTYKLLYQDMHDGKENGTYILQHMNYEGKYVWIKISYHNIFKDGKPILATGIVEKQENNIEVISKFEQEKAIAKLLQKDLLLTIQYNVTNKKIGSLYANKNLEYNYVNSNFTYEEFFEAALEHIANPEEKQQFNTLFNSKILNEYFEASKSSKHLNYRTIDNNGNIKWVSFTVNFLYEPFSGNRYMFGYIRDIDHKMKLELELDRKVEYDLITRIYIEDILKKITNYSLVNKCSSYDKCCFALIEIENFNSLKRIYGLDSAEKILFHIGRIIRIAFNNKYIAGRIPENKFGIFIPKVDNEKEIRIVLEDTMSAAINSYTFGDDNSQKLKVKISIYVSPVKHANYENLYNNSLKQLEKIIENNEPINIIDNFNDVYADENSLDVLESENQLNKLNSMFNNIIPKIINGKSFKQNIQCAIKTINEYYSAMKTSIYTLNNNNLKLSYEYTIGDIEEFEKLNININNYPGLLFLNKYRKTLIIEDIEILKNRYQEEYRFLKSINVYNMMIFPLIAHNDVIGYLTVSNCSKHIKEVEMATALSFFIEKELENQKYLELKDYYHNFDLVTNVQNYYRFRERVAVIRQSAISSLGVCCVGIDSFKEKLYDLNDDYLNDFAIQLSDNLRKVFNNNDIYRYDHDTFYVILEDCEYKEFKKKVSKFIKSMSKENNNFNIGFTWSDVDLNVDLLLKHADELMVLNRVNSKEKDESLEEQFGSLKEAIKLKWFEVYLQPKFDAINKEVVGAEALIRINHPEKGVISPVRFIPMLEKNRLIGKVDLYVFEEVCKILRQWKLENKNIIPISVNYSRVTILETGILNKTLKLMKKYDIDPSSIEIEITESVGNLEKETLKTIAKSFIENQIRLSLDDFGAEYSNLNTLANIPFHTLKIDKSLINEIVSNTRNQVLIENIVTVCKKLNILSLVEGVETELQYQEVKRLGCEIVQGYYFERPITIKEFDEKYVYKKTILIEK